MGVCQSTSAEDAEAAKRNKEIDQMLAREGREMRKEVKLLLLGMSFHEIAYTLAVNCTKDQENLERAPSSNTSNSSSVVVASLQKN
jgi:hypothetical protein